LRAQGQGARLGGRPAGDARLTRDTDLRSPQRRALGRGASRRRFGVLHREGPLARHRRHARGLEKIPFQPAPRRRTLVFLLMTKWCGSTLCSVAAMRYSSSGCRPGALTVQETSLPSALSCESSNPMRCTPTPSFAATALMRHAVGLDVMKASTLSRKDGLVMADSLLVPLGHVGELDVVADVLRPRSRAGRLLRLAEDLGELEAQLCELGRVGLDHRGILGPEKGAADQFDINPRRQVLGHGVRVVRANELDINTAQTPGMNRAAAITNARAGAEKLWAGTVVIHPRAKTGAHHHGPVESVIYVVSGRARMRWGDKLEFVAEA